MRRAGSRIVGVALVAVALPVLAGSCGSRTGLLTRGGDGGSFFPPGFAGASGFGGAPGIDVFDAGLVDVVPDVDDLPPPPMCDGGFLSLDVLVAPTVFLLVDQSGSMIAPFGRSTRWDALRDSFVGSGGLVPRFQRTVRFGLGLYSALSAAGGNGGPPIGECPRMTVVDPSLSNLDAIRSLYDGATPLEDTPTGDAIFAVLDRLAALPDSVRDPAIIVLATDGDPDTCAQLDPQNGQGFAVAAASAAFEAGVRTFVVSVGEGVVARSHLQDMANAGVGRGPGEQDAPFWEAGGDQGLRSALRQIIENEISCSMLLDGRIDPQRACEGSVLVDGRALPCDDPDGWRAVDGRQIELRGSGCARLESSMEAQVETLFPCDVVTAGGSG